MVENQIPAKDLTILDIFSIIRKKVKLIAWVALIALILGAAGGTAWAFISNATYGTQAEFYIYSEGANGYILSLLNSDSFAERLLLDENGLPADKKDTEAYKTALAAKAAVDAQLDKINEFEKKLAILPIEVNKLKTAASDADTRYKDAENLLVTYMGSYGLTEANTAKVTELQTNLDKAKEARDAAKTAYEEKNNEFLTAEVELVDLQEELDKLGAAKKAAYDVALAEFRSNEDNLKKINAIKKYITFEYAKSTSKDTTLEQSQSHLYVNIAVPFDKELAQELLDNVSTKLAPFVEESVIADAEERETECKVLSVFGSVDSVDYKNPLTQAALFAGIAAIAAATITSVIVVFAYIVKANEPAKEEAIPVEAAEEHPALEE